MTQLSFEGFETNSEKLCTVEKMEDLVYPEDLEKGAMICALEPEIRTDVPGCAAAFVSGDPFARAELVDYKQGDNPYRAEGNCGIVSVTNVLSIAGLEATEEGTTHHAIVSGECYYNPFGPSSENGGTTMELQEKILEDHGIASTCYASSEFGLNEIADAVENGQGVIAEVNADILWEEDLGSTGLCANHAITITGIARDAATGEIAGVYICDSGRGCQGDACRFVSAEQFRDCYEGIANSGAVVTDAPISTDQMERPVQA